MQQGAAGYAVLFHRLSDLFDLKAEAQHDGTLPKLKLSIPASFRTSSAKRRGQQGDLHARGQALRRLVRSPMDSIAERRDLAVATAEDQVTFPVTRYGSDFDGGSQEMYRLYRLGSLSCPDALWLDYEWDESFDNTEWRPYVEHFLREVVARAYEVVPLSSPTFERGEDFVEIAYLLDGVRAIFSSDLLLSLIVITSEDPHVLREVRDSIGNEVGWMN